MSAQSIVVFLLMLSVLVVLHEYGHFIVARLNGVRVTDFAMGMGPTLLKWTSPRSGTHYRLNLLPIGGYCQMKGEDGQSTEAEQQREFRKTAADYEPDNFQAKTPLRRLGIVLAGPVANFIVALVLLFGGALAFGIPGPNVDDHHLSARAGHARRQGGHAVGRHDRVDRRAPGDRRQDARGHDPRIDRQAPPPRLHARRTGGEFGRRHAGRVQGARGGKMEGRLGFMPLPTSQRVGVATAWQATWSQFTGVIEATAGALGALVTHPSTVAGQVQGPIGMARVSAQAQQFGPFMVFSLAAMISISLGIFNLLPIPALDGGRAVFILVEMLRGRPVDPEKEALVHVGGFAVLIALMLAVSFHDVSAAMSGRSAF